MIYSFDYGYMPLIQLRGFNHSEVKIDKSGFFEKKLRARSLLRAIAVDNVAWMTLHLSSYTSVASATTSVIVDGL